MFNPKKTLAVLLTSLAVLAAACGAPAATRPVAPGSQPATPNVLALETFLGDMAQNVAGDRLRVKTLMPVGADPHAFELAPEDVTKVAASDVIIANGEGFEEFLQKLIDNAGGRRQVIEAASGLTSRAAREGEVAEMSDADFADAMCASAGAEKSLAVTAGTVATDPAALPAQAGLFDVALNKQSDGSYAGFLRYAAGAGGDFQIAAGSGQVSISAGKDSAALEVEKSLSLACGGLAQGNIVELGASEYVLALTGFAIDRTPLLIGPAGGRHHLQGDPHFWLDPVSAIQYVENIRAGLSKADPEGASTYKANAEAYVARLKALDQWVTVQVKQIPPERRKLVTNHESFGYFADRYGFRIVGTIVPSVSSTASPSAQQLARLIDRVKATHAPAVFLETGTNPQLAEQLARDTGVKVVAGLYTHSTTDSSGPAPDYISMIRSNVTVIVEALK